MRSNTHVATAKFRQEGVHEWQSEEGSTDATNLAAALDAQTEATLAIAYEQRTANLIALQQLWLAEGAGPSLSVGVEIMERLDLA
jgi:hypothetical protein